MRNVSKLEPDVDLNYCVTASQCDHGAIQPTQKLTRDQLLKWVRGQVAAREKQAGPPRVAFTRCP